MDRNPFKGLRAFDTDDARVEEILGRSLPRALDRYFAIEPREHQQFVGDSA